MIRVAVVGAGSMGANHARVLSRSRDCDLVAVIDPRRESGERVAQTAEAAYYADYASVIGLIDAAVLATPSETHADIGVPLLNAGIDLLVEKPIASTAEDGRRLVEAAADSGRILMVGHIERFNPAVLELHRLLDQPVHLELTRIGPYSARVTTDVVLDLMIHDLDLAMSLADSEVCNMAATGQSLLSKSLDLATVLLTFHNGMTATLTASRVAQTKIRRIEITQLDSYIAVDLVRQDVTIHRVHHHEFLTDGGSVYRQSGLVEIPFLEDRGEPLALELAYFLTCVSERAAPRIGGQEGLRALELALHVRRSALTGVTECT